MTNNYKEQLLSYLTDNLENTSPTTDEIFKEIVEVDRSNWIGFMPSNWSNMKIEGLIKSISNDNIILYGGYIYNGVTKGIIIIVDNNFNPIKYFEQFSSGTDLRYIQCMKQADDGTFYFIDDTSYSSGETSDIINSQKRFVMVNNISVAINGDYEVNLRTSYILNSSYQNFYCRDMAKNPSSSHYVFIGKRFLQSGNRFLATSILELKINVGQPNEWTYLTTSDSNQQEYGGSFIKFNSEDKSYYRILVEYLGDAGTYCVSKGFNDNSLTSTFIYNNPNYRDDGIDTRSFNNQCVFMNENEVYYVSTNQRKTWNGSAENKHIALMYYNFTTNTTQIIFDKELGNAVYMTKEYILLYSNQGKLYIHYINNYLYENSEYTADYYVQRYEGTWNPHLIKEAGSCVLLQRGFYVDNAYNMLKIFCYVNNLRRPTWYFPVIKEIYNPTQYNGEPYVDTNVLSPLYANLYSNGSLVFSRNLYNISKQNNMSMSSVEIPNNYLNDLTITQNDLISDTNFQMNSDNTQWTKNIYEVVDLNFLNTISIIDEDTNTPYLDGAIKLNNAVTDGTATDYQNTPCNKFRINYADNTTSIDNVTWTSIDSTHYGTSITFYVDKAMISIDLISNDETTIYLTIPLEVEIGKTYTINQKIKVGE
jgi:hypothetical protein